MTAEYPPTATRRIPPRLGCTAVLIAALLVAGCGKSNVGTVSGTVTVDGEPAKTGSIVFYPQNKKARTAGAVIDNGRYTTEVALGTAKVEIRVPRVVGQTKLYDAAKSPVKPILAEALPPKYNDQTELTIDVQPGTNQHDFPLTTH